MFALIENGAIASIVSSVPAAPDPLPEGYVAPDYRPLVDGNIPAKTSTFSAVIPIAMDRWTIAPGQVTRGYEEVFPPLDEMRKRKADSVTAINNGTLSSGIAVTFPPYGTLNFSADHDTLCDLLACSHVCERMIAKTPSARDDLTPLVVADGSSVSVKCLHVPDIVQAYCIAHRDNRTAHSVKLRSIKLAPNLTALNAIT